MDKISNKVLTQRREALSPIRVFLVDDHQIVREGLKRMLELETDIQVVGEVARGEDAITQVELLSPDVVLMDIKMPGMDGITATRLLKEKMPDVKVVMLTLYDDEFVPQAIEAGAMGYILKDDVKREKLIQIIRDAYKGYSPLSPSLTRQVLTKLANLNRASRDSLLSERQRNILRLVAVGLVSKDIAAKLYISEATVMKEVIGIFGKLGVNNRPQAVSDAIKRRLI